MAVVAEDVELATIEGRLELAQDVRTEILGKRLHLGAVGREHHAAMRADLELGEPVLALLEVARHAALAANPALERDANQITLQIVGPLVIRTDEFVSAAGQLATEFRRPMRAAILHDADGAILRARHNHGRGPDVGADEVARIGNFRLERDVVPGGPVKNALDLARIYRLVGVDPVRNLS